MNEYESSGIAAGIGVGAAIFYLILIIATLAGMWKTFEKAGKPGWACIIPIYREIIMLEIVGKPMIWILWLLIPCSAPIFGIWLINLISKSFGKSEGYTVGLILLAFVFWPMLGFGDAKYLGPSAAEAQNGGFGNNPFNNPNNPFNKPFGNQDTPNDTPPPVV